MFFKVITLCTFPCMYSWSFINRKPTKEKEEENFAEKILSAAFIDCWQIRHFASLHSPPRLSCGHMFHLKIHLPYETSSRQDKVMYTETFVAWIKSHCLVHRSPRSCKVGCTSPPPDLFPFFARSVEQWSTRATYFFSLFECLPCYACLALQPKKRAVVEYWSLLFKPIQSFNPYIQCLNPFKIPSMHTVIYLTYNLHVHPIIWYIAQFTIIHSNNASEGDCWLLSHACQVDTVNQPNC